MAESRRNVTVGVFVLVGLGALGAMVILFGQAPQWLMQRDVYDLVIKFDSAAGIRAGTPVTILGKSIGYVEEVEFADLDNIYAGVRVIVSIHSRYRIPEGSHAETVEAGLLGGGRPPIEIVPADSVVYLKPGAEIRGAMKSSMSAIFPEETINSLDRTIRLFGDFADASKPVLDDLHQILMPRTEEDVAAGAPGNLASASARLDRLLGHFNEVIGDPEQQSRIKATIANLEQMSEDGVVMMADLKEAGGEVRGVVQKADGVITKVDASVDDIRQRFENLAQVTLTDLESAGRLLESLNVSASRMAQGEGSIGKAIHDDRLYESLVLTVQRLNDALEEYRLLADEWRARGVKMRTGL